MKLKTLKDFGWNDCVCFGDGYETIADTNAIKQSLRNHAIKWIKELQKAKDNDNYFNKELDRYIDWSDAQVMIEIIIHLYDLSEKDLK